ncbi:MAG: transposase [Pseudomonadales bacterium]
MTAAFSTSFKQQAVKKAVGRGSDVTLISLADEWGINSSTLQRWIRESRVQTSKKTGHDSETMKIEKRPQDWSKDERLEMVIACGSLNEVGASALCREKGIYPYHVEQWKAGFVDGVSTKSKIDDRAEFKQLKAENKELKKELRRKEKALAETAALLVLQKK